MSEKTPGRGSSTPTPLAGGRLNGLDHLRAFAITYVVLNHYGTLFPHPRWVEGLGSFGWTGVDLFFTLSGYLMGGQLMRRLAQGQRVRARAFYLNRFFRIIPAYWFTVAIYFTVPPAREFPLIPPLWKFLTFTQNLGFNPELGHAFSHAWSLCVEEHFYLFLPVFLAFLGSGKMHGRRWSVSSVIFILVGGMVLRAVIWWKCVDHAYFPSWYEQIYCPTYDRLDGLLVGVSAAAFQIYVPTQWQSLTRRWPLLLAGSGFFLFAGYLLSTDRTSLVFTVIGFPTIATGYGLLLVAALSPGCFLHRTRLAVTNRVALWSYSLYLIHKVVVHVVQSECGQTGLDQSSTRVFVISIVVSLFAAWIMYRLLERPFLVLRDALLGGRPLQADHKNNSKGGLHERQMHRHAGQRDEMIHNVDGGE
jgi:peptidoglycan/LPS O-acetylase OafA/YrhL